VVGAVGLFDSLTFQPADDLALECRGIPVADGAENLVLRAARLLRRKHGVGGGAWIGLEKRIPPGRGFGGGSADAAGALAGLSAMWGLGVGPEDLAAVGAEIGSDVPLFFSTPVAILRGRGERIEPTDARPAWWVALAWPEYGLSTKEVYAAYDALDDRPEEGPGATGILSRLGGRVGGLGPYLVNDLEAAARSIRLNSIDLRHVLEAAGADAVGMTGSGSAYFALADSAEEARRWRDAARAAGAEAKVVQLLGEAQQQEITSWKSPM
jgi:4-diphosphocytidyl-2-C-methyl-D-erythritol kinase